MRRIGAAALAACAVACPVIAWAASPAPSSTYTYGAGVDASALEQTVTLVQVATGPAVDGRYPHAQALLGSPSQSRGRASVFDPGALVQSIPPQVRNCSTAIPGCSGGLPAPDYPFVAEANWPSQRDAAGSVAPQDVGPAHIDAGAFSAAVTTTSAVARASGHSFNLGLAAVRVGDGEADAAATWSAGSASGAAHSRLSGIRIADVLAIDQMSAAAEVKADPASPGSASGSLTLSGITLAGMPAAIDAQGVHLAGQSLPAGAGLAAAQQALDHLSQVALVRLLPAAQVTRQGRVTYTGEALEVVEAPAGGAPQFTVAMGRLNLDVLSLREDTLGVGSPVPAQRLTMVPGLRAQPAISGATLPEDAHTPAARGRSTVKPALALTRLRLAPAALLVALFLAFELALLSGIAVLLWPAPAAPRAPTLRRL